MKSLRGIVLALAFAATLLLIPETGSIAGSQRAAAKDPIRVSAKNGDIRCTATFPKRTIQPGRSTRVRFKLTNEGTDDYLWHNPSARLAFRDAGGVLLWRTNMSLYAPGPPPLTIPPGETVPWYVHDTRIRWSGPLTVRPICVGLGKRMPTVELHVAAPGPTESTTASIEKAVARPGSPFQACPPGPQGQARTGTLEPAAGENLPPLSVRCWADVRTEAGFDVVGLNLVAPGDGPDYTIAEGKGLRPGEEVDLPGTGSFMAARWTFVVTDTYARPVYAKALTRTAGAGEFPHYEFRRDERRSLYNNVCSDGDGAPNTWRHVPTFAWPFELDWISACSE